MKMKFDRRTREFAPDPKKVKESVENFSNKILVVLPFWKADRQQAMLLAKLLADMQPQHSEAADILFVARFDERHDSDTIKYISRKFNTYVFTSERREVGWPQGCNGLFFGAMSYIYREIFSRRFQPYKAVFYCAADSAPLRIDALQYVSDQWDEIGRIQKVVIAGPLIDASFSGREHINGDATLLSGNLNFLRWLIGTAHSQNGGWDWSMAKQFKKQGWANLPGVVSWWNTPTVGESTIRDIRKRGVVWLHGVKDNSALVHSRKCNL